jgi:hypothetical protein
VTTWREGFEMPTDGELALQDIEIQFVRSERRSRIITVAIAAAVVAGAALFLLFSYNALQNLSGQLKTVRLDLTASEQRLTNVNEERNSAQQQLSKLQADAQAQAGELAKVNAQLSAQRQQADSVKQQLDQANAKLVQLTNQIAAATDLIRYLHPIDFADVKSFTGVFSLDDLLLTIVKLQAQNLKFDLANRPEVGFTSPGFAGYVLQFIGKAPKGMAPEAVLRTLPRTDHPVLGDVILYETGFALFYFKDRRNAPFVIGMTPLGIAPLNFNFHVKQIGALRTNVYAGP